MKVNFRPRGFVGVIVISLLFVILHYTGLFAIPENGVRAVVSFFSKFVYQSAAANYISLRPENQIVQDALAKAKIESVHAALLDDENTSLRKQLDFFSKNKYKHVGADVIGRSLQPVDTLIIINKGTRDGVEKDQAVIVNDGLFIGKITNSEYGNSTVRLLSDGESRTAATVMNLDRSIGLVEGGYGISVRMNLIPQSESVAIGDTIITSGLEPSIPRGLIIGKIEAVEKEAYQPFQSAVLTPAADLNWITVVSVITGTEQKV